MKNITKYIHLLDENKEFDDIDECIDDLFEKAQIGEITHYHELGEEEQKYRKEFYKLLKEKFIISYETSIAEENDDLFEILRERYLYD